MSEMCISEWGFVGVGFCPMGLCPMGFCPSGVLSWIRFYRVLFDQIMVYYCGLTSTGMPALLYS